MIAHTYGASEMGLVSALTPPEHDPAHPGAFGPSVASTVVVLPVDQIPLTGQGKPNRPEIRRLGRELAAATGR